MTNCRQYLGDVLTLDGTLGKSERKKQTAFFAFASTGVVFGVLHLSTAMDWMLAQPLYFGASVLSTAQYMALFVAILCKCTFSPSTTAGIILFLTVPVLFWDINSRTIGIYAWPLLVIAIDMLLVMQVPARYTYGLVAFVIVYLFVMGLEESFRFGILDAPGLMKQEGEHSRAEYFSRMVDCERPPCAAGFPTNMLLPSLAVFIFDFILTRGFAHEVLQEQASMQRTINAVQEIASLLAKYDVEAVAQTLRDQEEALPEQMYETLQTMEENLRRYRPYLPAALFEEMEIEDERVHRVHPSIAPGADSKVATIVFTDIRLSTLIWEHAPEGMRAALKIHNSVIRDAIQAYNGYEVKTIGDAFMVAFSSTEDGVDFGLHVHELLLAASWPASLLEDAPICAEQGSLWGGLTVRIGVNTGPISSEENALTGRTDYFGHTVNVAARIEGACQPGAVALSTAQWDACSPRNAIAGKAEEVQLRGLSGKTSVICIWPISLGGRENTPLLCPQEGSGSLGGKESISTTSGVPAFLAATAKPFDATVATIQLTAGTDGDPSVLRYTSTRLATLSVALDQSGGTLVTLLGSRVCVGWNLTRPVSSHMESAVRFAQRIQIACVLSGAGLVSGPVQHGDVGARQHRFVTVTGAPVYGSWHLCDDAAERNLCLFQPHHGTLPTTLADVVLRDKLAGTFSVRSGL